MHMDLLITITLLNTVLIAIQKGDSTLPDQPLVDASYEQMETSPENKEINLPELTSIFKKFDLIQSSKHPAMFYELMSHKL